jgi:hypothetical protein
MPQCHVCIKLKATKVWVWSPYMERMLTCDTCHPPDSRFTPDQHSVRNMMECESLGFMGRENYPWAWTNVQQASDSFLCFDRHRIAPLDDDGLGLSYMGLYMYGEISMPEKFQFREPVLSNEFIVCDACGRKRHAERRDGKGTVTNDVHGVTQSESLNISKVIKPPVLVRPR